MPEAAREPLLLLPGLLCDAGLWPAQVAGLADVADCQVADLGGADTFPALAREVLAAAPARFALAGFSFGGYVAQEILRQAPQRVSRLALLDTGYRPDTPERAAERRSAQRMASFGGEFLGITGPLMRTFIAPARLGDQALVGTIEAMTRRVGRAVFLRQNAMPRVDGEAVLRALRVPTLVLAGEFDVRTPPALAREMAALIPGAELVSVPDAGHQVVLEQTPAVMAAIARLG